MKWAFNKLPSMIDRDRKKKKIIINLFYSFSHKTVFFSDVTAGQIFLIYEQNFIRMARDKISFWFERKSLHLFIVWKHNNSFIKICI